MFLRQLNIARVRLSGAHGLLVPLVLYICVVSILAPHFLTIQNATEVLRQASVLGILALGVTVVTICGHFDLSVGSTLTLAGVVLIGVHESAGPGLGVLACLLVGLAIGCVNGLLVAVLRLNSLIVTLGMQSVLIGLGLLYTGGKTQIVVVPQDDWFTFIGRGVVLGVPVPVLLLIGFAVVLSFLLTRTVIGRRFFAIGGNETASLYSGIDVRRGVFIAYAISGLMAGIAAVVFGARVMAFQNNSGDGYEIAALAGIILGGVNLSGGAGSAFGAVFGVVVLGFIQNGLLLMGLPYFVQWLVTWVVIIAAVWASVAGKRGHVFA